MDSTTTVIAIASITLLSFFFGYRLGITLQYYYMLGALNTAAKKAEETKRVDELYGRDSS